MSSKIDIFFSKRFNLYLCLIIAREIICKTHNDKLLKRYLGRYSWILPIYYNLPWLVARVVVAHCKTSLLPISSYLNYMICYKMHLGGRIPSSFNKKTGCEVRIRFALYCVYYFMMKYIDVFLLHSVMTKYLIKSFWLLSCRAITFYV